MRAAAAALPEPCSATTSTGTSFCDNSRITASTVRMPALTLSSHTRAPPFFGIGVPAVARISVLSRFILFLFRLTIPRPRLRGEDVLDKGLTHSRAHSLPIRSNLLPAAGTIHAHCFNDLRLIPSIETAIAMLLIRYHIADKWENNCPHLR